MIFSVIKKKKLKNIVNERNYGFIVAGNDFWPTLYLHEFRVNTSGLAHRWGLLLEDVLDAKSEF